MISIRSLMMSAVVLSAFAGTAMSADRAPTPEEQTRIEAALKSAGYSSWKKIELDDGKVWEIDDAVHSDGKTYDLELDPSSLAVIKKSLD
jgi:hypothetical protein